MITKRISTSICLYIIHPAIVSVFIWGQLQVKIGNDTTFCADNIGQGLQIASQLCVTGGVPPYTYCWSMPEPFQHLPNRWNYASNVLNDTTLENPILTGIGINRPQRWTQFNLKIKDVNGEIAVDSINVRFSEYNPYTMDEVIIPIIEGDSIFIERANSGGGILPYTSYTWIPKEGVQDPYASQTWFKPDSTKSYYCIVTDSVGCEGKLKGFTLFVVKNTNLINTHVDDTFYQINNCIFFDNLNKENVKLSFYDTSGNMLHEGYTTSNQYHPSLLNSSGSVIICKKTINNIQKTIKYIIQ